MRAVLGRAHSSRPTSTHEKTRARSPFEYGLAKTGCPTTRDDDANCEDNNTSTTRRSAATAEIYSVHTRPGISASVQLATIRLNPFLFGNNTVFFCHWLPRCYADRILYARYCMQHSRSVRFVFRPVHITTGEQQHLQALYLPQ